MLKTQLTYRTAPFGQARRRQKSQGVTEWYESGPKHTGVALVVAPGAITVGAVLGLAAIGSIGLSGTSQIHPTGQLIMMAIAAVLFVCFGIAVLLNTFVWNTGRRLLRFDSSRQQIAIIVNKDTQSDYIANVAYTICPMTASRGIKSWDLYAIIVQVGTFYFLVVASESRDQALLKSDKLSMIIGRDPTPGGHIHLLLV